MSVAGFRRPWRAAEVAERMGKKPDWFSHNVGRLRREHGFPATIPGFGNVYDPVAIEEWLARQRAPKATAAALEVAATELTDDQWGEILDRRALVMAPASGRA